MVKRTERRQLQRGVVDLTFGARSCLTALSDILQGIRISDLKRYLNVIEEECGDALITISKETEYWDPASEIKWQRLETSEERDKRVAQTIKANKARKITREKTKQDKIRTEKLELARLMRLYSMEDA